jgi:hypothetical protein
MSEIHSVRDLPLSKYCVIVCGGRDYDDREFAFRTLDWMRQELSFSAIAHGGASGADALAAEWAYDRDVPQMVCKADWGAWGRAAGPIRNIEMFKKSVPLNVIAFPGGKGTRHMMRVARAGGAKVWEWPEGWASG